MAKRKKVKEPKLSLKEKDQILKQAGFTQKESRLYRNRSEENVMKLINSKRKEDKKETFKPKTFLKEFKNLLKGEEDTRKAVENVYKEKSVVSKRKPNPPKENFNAGGQKVLILWKDVTGNVDKDWFSNMVSRYRHESTAQLVQSAQGWRKMTFGEIGEYVVLNSRQEQRKETVSLYEEYSQVYFGIGSNYSYLLQIINGLMLSLYQSTTKGYFIRDLVRAFQKVNPKVSERLQKDFL